MNNNRPRERERESYRSEDGGLNKRWESKKCEENDERNKRSRTRDTPPSVGA